MAAKLKSILTKLKPRHNKKQIKKSVSKSRARRIVRFAAIGRSTLILFAVLGFGLLVFADRNDNVQAKLSGNSTPSVTAAPTAIPAQANSSTTKSGSSGLVSNSTPTNASPNQVAIQLQCSIDYGNNYQDYSQSVIDDGSKLESAEGGIYSSALQQEANSPDAFSTLLSETDADITEMNTAISTSWNNTFVINKQLPGCSSGQPNIPALLQMPQCHATDFSDYTNSCMAQINPSLGIGT